MLVLAAWAVASSLGEEDGVAVNLGEGVKASESLGSQECALVAKENEQVRSRLQELLYTNGQLKIDSKMRSQRERSLRRTVDKLKKKAIALQAATHGNENLETVNDELNRRNDGMIKTNAALLDTERKLAAKGRAKNKKITEQEKLLKGKDKKIVDQENAAKTSADEEKKLTGDVVKLTAGEDNLKAQLKAVETAEQKAMIAHNAEIKKHQRLIEADKMSMEDLKSALAKARAKQTSQEAATAASKQIHADLKKRNAELQSETAQLKATVDEAKKKKDKSDDARFKLKATVRELKAALEKHEEAAAKDDKEKAAAKAKAAAKERSAKAMKKAEKETVEAVDADNVIDVIRGEGAGKSDDSDSELHSVVDVAGDTP